MSRRRSALSNGSPGVYAYVGNAQVKAGKLADAEGSFRQAIRLKGDFAVAIADLGLVLNEQGKLKEAEAMLTKALALDPRNPRSHFNLGLNLQRQGNNARAVDAYRQSIALKPDFAVAFNNYGNTLTALGASTRRSQRLTSHSICARVTLALITIAGISSISFVGLTKRKTVIAGRLNVSRTSPYRTTRSPMT